MLTAPPRSTTRGRATRTSPRRVTARAATSPASSTAPVGLVPQPGAQRGDAGGRLLEALHAEPTLLHGGDDGVDHQAEPRVRVVRLGVAGVADAQQVGARGQRPHRALAVPDPGRDRLHVEGVGDDHAVEAEVVAQQAEQDRAQGGRLGVVRREDDVRGHHAPHAGLDDRPERRQVALAEHLDRVGDGRQREVGVGAGRAVTREVLGAGGDPRALEAGDERRAVAGDEVGRRRRTSGRR